ncbi:MAG: putative metal-binding motif-containing protein [Myxococcaceae bacterium]|nr:putative metal-binding motif-containing protein [Myxococcaceae bacterium]
MPRPSPLSLAVLLLGSGCLPDADEAAVRVDVTYQFKAGCITVLARDAESPARETSTSLPVLARGPSTVRLAVFRGKGWSHKLELSTTAHEQTCEGPVVSQEVRAVELREPRVEQLDVTLNATDTDDDGYIPTAKGGTDCDDARANVNPGTPEACDGLDNDCDGPEDEDFPLKGTACADACPGGQYVCNASRTDVECAAPPKVAVFPDSDGDGAGDELAASSGSVCPGETLPGAVANQLDCDDLDKHNRRGQAELCDGRDNTCDSASDEGDVCQGKGWRALDDEALTNDRQWKTVALGANGFPVWVAGDDGALAVREAAGEPFRSLDGSCGSHDWTVAWVRPTDGVVFLGGAGGPLARHDGTSCVNQPELVPPATASVTGIIGFPPATMLYVVNTAGRLSTWEPPAAALEQFNLGPESYTSLHALDPTYLLGVGYTEETTSRPHATSYPGTGTDVTRHTLRDTPSPYDGGLRGVWMGSPTFSYAVGDDGLVMQWDGQTTWTRVPPPEDSPTVDFTSVVVLDPSSIYTTDADGVVRRLTPGGWITPAPHDAPHPLRDIAATAPSNIWAVGDNGLVLHFPE